MKKWIPIFLVGLTLLGCSDTGDHRSDEAVIRQKTQEYVKAYNQKKSEKLAQYWQEDAEYINLISGRTVSGREQIQEEFAEVFEDSPDLSMSVSVDSIEFPSRVKAVELGIATLTDAEGNKENTRYRAVYEYENGDWFLASTSEIEDEEPPTHYEKLKDLDWLIGNWEDANENVQIDSTYEWDKYKNFIKHYYKVNILGKEELEGKRIIGWDPVNELIRSWHFDSHGGFAEAKWQKVGDQWVVESLDTLPDGGIGSQINVLTPNGRDSYTYEILGRTVDGEILPNIAPVKVVRKRG